MQERSIRAKGGMHLHVLTIHRLEDESTTEQFKFIAHCDRCGSVVKTCISVTESCYKPRLFMHAAARRAKELLWLQAHEQAKENAAREALQELNRCEVCGAMVCRSCTVISDALDGGVCCRDCARLVDRGGRKEN